MAHTIKIGKISSTNPSLWVDMNTFETYEIATNAPQGAWLSVNQFCSILSARWLSGGCPDGPYGISNFDDAEKKAMAERLIGFQSLQDQVDYAKGAIGGQSATLQEVTTGVSGGGYGDGALIWAGNDFHVIAITVISDTQFRIYDSNSGAVNTRDRSTFGELMQQLNCDAFVVKT